MNAIFSMGLILLFGLLGARLINKIRFPSITAYILLGILIGPSFANFVSSELIASSGIISNIVLGLIAFTLGQNFTKEFFGRIGKSVVCISISESVLSCLLVTLVVFLIAGQPFYIAFIFGAIASATAPAATVMVVREYRSRGRFTDILLGVIATDDAWCLILFAFSLAFAKAFVFHVSNGFFLKVAAHSLMEILGAFLLGGLLAYLVSYISNYIRTQTELLIYVLGFVLLATGLAMRFHFSVLLANMCFGAVLINIRNTNFRLFEVLRSVDSPLYLLFFCLAGANLEIGLIKNIGLIGLVYLIFRVVGKVIGAHLGAGLVKAEEPVRRYLGLGLLPQAGVALGCARVVKTDFPEVGGLIFTTIIATTVIYELIGPICAKIALTKAGEISAAESS